MKKLFLFLALFLPFSAFSQKAKYDKFIEKYDVLKYLPDISNQNPSIFWRTVVNNNPELVKNTDKFLKPKGAAKEALKRINEANRKNKMMEPLLPRLDNPKFNESVHEVLLGDSCGGENITVAILDSPEKNAFTTPDGLICVLNGIIEKLEKNNEMIIGVLAHEVTHYMLRHALMHEYETIKKEKKNNIVAGIAGTAVAIGGLAAATSGVYIEELEQNIQGIVEGANEWTRHFNYRYSREQEIESDICAYRFLEWIGIDPNTYIQALEKIDLDLFTSDDKDNDHPTISFRTELLRQLQPAPYPRSEE